MRRTALIIAVLTMFGVSTEAFARGGSHGGHGGHAHGGHSVHGHFGRGHGHYNHHRANRFHWHNGRHGYFRYGPNRIWRPFYNGGNGGYVIPVANNYSVTPTVYDLDERVAIAEKYGRLK